MVQFSKNQVDHNSSGLHFYIMKTGSEIHWGSVAEGLHQKGYYRIEQCLWEDECNKLIQHYDDERLYRNVISMERYRFGIGQYKYYKYPLPNLIQKLRTEFYGGLAPIANQWNEWLSIKERYPETHSDFLEQCHQAGQQRPTPLILRYEARGFNTLHQDLYGDVYFPFQVVFLLTQNEVDHHGGEFVLVEQIPRAQSKAEVVKANRGDAIIFTTNFRPVKGTRGFYKTKMKHGVSEVTSGKRYAMGIIFHDAK